MRPVILLDIDGVVANFIDGCLPHIKDITGRDHHHDDVDQFLIEKALGLDVDQTRRLYERVCLEGWCRSLPPYEGAREGVAALREFADVVPVTAPFWTSRYWVRERYEWILEHLEIPEIEVIQAHAKFRIDGDAFVDDRTAHLTNWMERHPRGRAVQFAQRYNRNDGWSGPSFSTWPEIVAYLKDTLGEAAETVTLEGRVS